MNAATLAVLQANGVEVVLPEQQGCCGAASHHQGELEQTRELARDLVKRFEAAAAEQPLDAVLVAASGCGHTLKQYPQLLEGNASFSAPVLDVHEFLINLGLSDDFRARLQPLALKVAYHDACHMIHGQGIKSQPRELLQAIPGLSLREATEAGVCCGSAGIYNLVQPEEAAALGRLKAADLAATGADVVASANIGCSLQIRRHLSEKMKAPRVNHPIELLALSANLTMPELDQGY